MTNFQILIELIRIRKYIVQINTNNNKYVLNIDLINTNETMKLQVQELKY